MRQQRRTLTVTQSCKNFGIKDERRNRRVKSKRLSRHLNMARPERNEHRKIRPTPRYLLALQIGPAMLAILATEGDEGADEPEGTRTFYR